MSLNIDGIDKNLAELPDSEYDREWPEEKNYKMIKNYNDPRFGQIQVLKKNDEVLFIKDKIVNSKKLASKEIRAIQKRKSLNHINLLELVDYSTSVKKNLCSTNYIIRGFYRFPKTDLFKEHNLRKKNNRVFSTQELNKIGFSSLNGLDHIHAQGKAHGDIRPMMIGSNPQANIYQVLDRLNEQTNIEKTQINNLVEKKAVYMSPELYKKIQGKDKKVEIDFKKDDMFAVGMVLLQLGNNQSVQDIYLENGEIDQYKLDEHIRNYEFKHRSNPQGLHVVKSLLQADPINRPFPRQVLATLPNSNTNYTTYSTPFTQTTTYVNSQPQYINKGPIIVNRSEVLKETSFGKPKPYVLRNAPNQTYTTTTYSNLPTTKYSYVNNPVKVSNTPVLKNVYPQTFRSNVQYVNNNVEVRRGSHIPPEDHKKVSRIKKRYIMKEDGTVVEVDANEDIMPKTVELRTLSHPKASLKETIQTFDQSQPNVRTIVQNDPRVEKHTETVVENNGTKIIEKTVTTEITKVETIEES